LTSISTGHAFTTRTLDNDPCQLHAGINSSLKIDGELEGGNFVRLCEYPGIVRTQLAFIKVSAVPFHTDGIAIFGIKDASLFEDTGVAYQRSNRAKNLREFLDAIRKRKKELAKQSLPHSGENSCGDAMDSRQLKLF
jgi:hypothetical protein